MAAKLLVGFGAVLIVLGGLIYLVQQMALRFVASGYQASVQQYASESAAVGQVIAEGLAGLGVIVLVIGLLVALSRNIWGRMPTTANDG